MSRRPRLLFLAEGATMQHFVRPLALAAAADPERFEIHFRAPRRYRSYLDGKPFQTGELDTMPAERFLANLAAGAPLFPAGVLARYVEADRALLREIRPDLAIGDLRFSLPIAARLEGIRSAALMNAYWSPYARQCRGIIPELPITRLIPPRWLGGAYRLGEPFALAAHMRPINRVRKCYGLNPLPPDPRYMYTDGDLVLYPDLPSFIPVTGAPAHHRYVGPCLWELPGARPEWWDAMVADPKPKVLVSLGSSGPVRILPALLGALASRNVSVVLTTSGRFDPQPGVYAAPLLPFTETAALCRLVVSHGGSSGYYPALAAGTPVLGIPSNADQQISAEVLAASQAGLRVRVEEATAQRLGWAIDTMLTSPQFSQAATRWKGEISRSSTPRLFGTLLNEVV